jgi:hypothetical protein
MILGKVDSWIIIRTNSLKKERKTRKKKNQREKSTKRRKIPLLGKTKEGLNWKCKAFDIFCDHR